MDNTFLIQQIISSRTKGLETSIKAKLALAGKGNSRLYRSIKVNTKFKKESWDMELSMNSYGKWVDSGRRPGKQPPIKPIKEWCVRKGIDTKFAWGIAKKIGKEGIPPTKFLQPLTDFKKKIIPELRQLYSDYIRGQFKDFNITMR
jgi:hypothetical protein